VAIRFENQGVKLLILVRLTGVVDIDFTGSLSYGVHNFVLEDANQPGFELGLVAKRLCLANAASSVSDTASSAQASLRSCRRAKRSR